MKKFITDLLTKVKTSLWNLFNKQTTMIFQAYASTTQYETVVATIISNDSDYYTISSNGKSVTLKNGVYFISAELQQNDDLLVSTSLKVYNEVNSLLDLGKMVNGSVYRSNLLVINNWNKTLECVVAFLNSTNVNKYATIMYTITPLLIME